MRITKVTKDPITGFNPLPAIKLGDAKDTRSEMGERTCFNPLPAIKLGDAP